MLPTKPTGIGRWLGVACTVPEGAPPAAGLPLVPVVGAVPGAGAVGALVPGAALTAPGVVGVGTPAIGVSTAPGTVPVVAVPGSTMVAAATGAPCCAATISARSRRLAQPLSNTSPQTIALARTVRRFIAVLLALWVR